MRDDDFIRHLGENIKSLRKQKGLTQMDLSAICNMDKPNIVRIETGRTNPTTKTLKIIADALGVKVSDLFSFE
jgi:transcriptional regulator with XRE-family HTH domain